MKFFNSEKGYFSEKTSKSFRLKQALKIQIY